MKLPFNYIVVEGIIGAGKTTLAEFVAESTGMEIVKERFEENPFLSRFYEDKETFAVGAEFFFLEDRVKQMQEAIVIGNGWIADFSIYKSWAFGNLNLKGELLNHFQEKFHQSIKKLPVPDLIIYLKNDVDTVVQQIKSRGRSYEQQITKDYLTSIEKKYQELWDTFPYLHILEINSKILEFPYSHAQFERLLKYLSKAEIRGFTRLRASDID